MAHASGETSDPTLPFDPLPCDRRPRQAVERVTLERRPTCGEDDEH